MKKLLMSTAIVAAGAAFAVSPAKADGIKLDLSGHAKLYVDYDDQHGGTGSGSDVRSVDILRDTEIHFTGETTLDNGLTVGFHEEADVDNAFPGTGTDGITSQESYAYFSGAWGRVNFGKEDGAAYLLQVAAPSADENFDGLRQYINPFNYSSTSIGGARAVGAVGLTALPFNASILDYAQDATAYANKLTYLTPVFAGFQFGGSYTPSVGDSTADSALYGVGQSFLHGGYPSAFGGSQEFGNSDSIHTAAGVSPSLGSAVEGSGRWEGQWRDFGFTIGGGYTHIFSENDNYYSAANPYGGSDLTEYNGGLNVAFGPFNVGGAYLHNSGGINGNSTGRTYDVGADYTIGPFKLGASWLNNHQEEGVQHVAVAGVLAAGAANGSLNTNRWSGGVVYTYGPGMTFRGSVGYVESKSDSVGTGSVNGFDGLLGTQINF